MIRVALRFSAVILALSMGAGAALAEVAPKLDVKATCQRAEPLSGAEKSAYQSCLTDEMEAQKELAKTWSGFKPAARATCLQETKIGGAPSYVELIACLQLDKQAAEASRENHKQLDLPSSRSALTSVQSPKAPK